MAAGFRFTQYVPPPDAKTGFDALLEIFLQLITITSGDVAEALYCLNSLYKQYKITNDDYGIGNFIEDLKAKGYIDDGGEKGEIRITGKSEQQIRKSALEEIFGKLKKSGRGNHN